ncbi:hypothetical protein HCN44_009074 [Aphidius gifuensis]|uniref:Uncharacterized protein n=1 Tax=Aphidius gifuensis TaxID=684658 RepID=A0A834Y151_APHGI|nr:hypothetical protein HCN44_009074 [Aphidius gifuensis]
MKLLRKNVRNDTSQSSSTTTTTIDYIRKIFIELLKIYDADKTGRVNYALESASGQIIKINDADLLYGTGQHSRFQYMPMGGNDDDDSDFVGRLIG